MPDLLDEEALTAALAALPDWSGDGTAIRRTVGVGPQVREELVADLQAVAREMNHDPDLEFPEGALRIQMSTHSAGGVTDLDIAYAHRVDELIVRRGLRPFRP